MNVLTIISVAFWIFLAYESVRTFLSLKDAGLSKREVTAITILLLCGLNIAKDGISLLETSVIFLSGQKLTEYLYFGTTMFQLLLAHFVLDHIKHDNTNINKKD
jgi:hypothetical protein